MAFAETQPFGEVGQDWRTGMICSLLANIHRDKDKRLEPYKPTDFIPSAQVQKKQTPGDMLNIAREITLALGGEVRLPE